MVYKRLDPTDEQGIIAVIPDHDELAKGTLKGILRMARVTLEEFLRNK